MQPKNKVALPEGRALIGRAARPGPRMCHRRGRSALGVRRAARAAGAAALGAVALVDHGARVADAPSAPAPGGRLLARDARAAVRRRGRAAGTAHAAATGKTFAFDAFDVRAHVFLLLVEP